MPVAGSTSYRSSHLEKGADYHANFAEKPRRKLLWQIEQQILNDIRQRYLAGVEFDYLDFACGTGRIISHLERWARSSVGVDISPSMLEVAAAHATRSELIHADLTSDDVLGDRRFHLITAFRFFPNAEPALRADALRVLTRHLRSDGILVFNNHLSTSGIQKRILRLASGGSRGVRGMSPAEATTLVESAGLAVAAKYHAGIVPEYENFLLRPRWLVQAVERIGTRLPLADLAEDVLYVCRLREGVS
jgi:SAM-dependent methyltransferase